MTCTVDHAPVRRQTVSWRRFWDKLSIALPGRSRARAPYLDPRQLSDHLKRDLGFLDGRGGC